MADSLTISEAGSSSAAQSGGLGQSLIGALNLKSVNRALHVLAVVAAAYFLLVIVSGAVKLMGVSHHIRQLEADGSKTAAASAAPSAKLEINRVDPALGNRNVFQPSGAQQVSVSDDGASVGSTGAYRLVGISEAKNPADTYVMVENTQTKLTYFLQYDQLVEGLELEKILEDKVIVKIGGDSVELK